MIDEVYSCVRSTLIVRFPDHFIYDDACQQYIMYFTHCTEGGREREREMCVYSEIEDDAELKT